MPHTGNEFGEEGDEFIEDEDDFAETDGICPRCGWSVGRRPDREGLACLNERCVNGVGHSEVGEG